MKSDARQAISDMAYDLRDIFKKYSLSARKKAWDSLQQGTGKRHMKELIENPNKPIVSPSQWLNFKEWLENN